MTCFRPVDRRHGRSPQVLGHSKCGAVYGATKAYLSGARGKASALEGLLQGLGSVAQQAAEELGADAKEEDVAARAVKVCLGARFWQQANSYNAFGSV